MAKRAIGIKGEDPLTVESLDKIRDTAGRAYDKLSKSSSQMKADKAYLRELRKIQEPFDDMASDFSSMANKSIQEKVRSFMKTGFSPKNGVEAIKRLRKSAKTRMKSMDDPEKVAMGKAELSIANALEGVIERNLKQTGKQALVAEFRKARELIAKTYTIESALTQGSNNVDAAKLARMLDKGAPLSGELKKVASFAQKYKSVTPEIKRSTAMPSWFDLTTAMGTTALTQNPLAMSAIFARPAVRGLIKSSPYQSLMTRPAATMGAQKILDEVRKRPMMLTRGGIVANERAN